MTTICTSLLLLGGAERALARADCSQRDPQADAFITITSLTTTQLTARVTNAGPCNVPDAVVSFTLPAGSNVSAITTSPSGWNCTGLGLNAVTCGPGSPTIGVPGNHDFTLSFTLGAAADQTITAGVTLGGGASACTDGNSRTTCDPIPDNNTMYALVISAGNAASFTTCTSKPCTEYVDMAIPAGNSGGTAQVQLLQSFCPASFANSFGKCVSIVSGITNAPGTITKLTLTIDASLAHGPVSGVNVINSTNGGPWSVVGACASPPTTFPCVYSKTTFTVGTKTFIQFIIKKLDDDGWGFDG